MIDIVLGIVVFAAIVVALGLIVIGVRALLLPSQDVSVVVNGERPIPARTGDKLLNVLVGADIHIPSACAGAGTCGLCRVAVTKGGGEPLPTELARLSRTDVRNGIRLACQVGLRDDVEVGVSPDLLEVETFTCTVVSTRNLSPLIREIVLDVPAGQDFEARAGAFVQVAAPPYRHAYVDYKIDEDIRRAWQKLGLDHLVAESHSEVVRAYSLANTPADTSRIVLFVRLAVPPLDHPNAPPGIVSSWLFGLVPGGMVEVSGPYGEFGAKDTRAEMVFIGGGVGMAPLRSIIHDQLERVGTDRKLSFFYGARSQTDLFHAAEFEELARHHTNFSWIPALSEPVPGSDWEGAIGFVHNVAYESYLRDHPAPEKCEFYLCGPPLMIEAAMAMLDACGVEDDAIFFDDFGV